ncbi:hypothetical protein LEP1GSC121_1810 [Leptospira borgpetersenii serovar Castellonis str. 200801910]|uniref:Uncharacterized protein n=1 Tax=Leptospira borgpetersenii str. 200701203 TaxID=1193007 RepID=M3GGZ4_LEPBO|nr:hypothetical protein LEP1GSC121_1810 [Leptospira borgpetersenii serovar Castellonis str. 200801910]EMG00247.1 hypothetical protein LEP1GSC123_2333 [Leptospira borgpetersenii str. 200701203]
MDGRSASKTHKTIIRIGEIGRQFSGFGRIRIVLESDDTILKSIGIQYVY